jgi:site-specific DNA-methyltransferase (adenine-specific)
MVTALFSSAVDTWATPIEFFRQLDAEFNFNLDPCCFPHSARCDRYWTPQEDGLVQPWRGRVYCNPPYGRQIARWFVKGRHEIAIGNAEVVVYLVPSRTDTRWWHDHAMHATEQRFVRGRLKFGGSTKDAPFPSAVLVFRRQPPTI